MKQCTKLFTLISALCLFQINAGLAATESTTAHPATAVTTESTEGAQARLENAIQKISLQTESLQKEVTQLRTELTEVKKQKEIAEQKSAALEKKQLAAAHSRAKAAKVASAQKAENAKKEAAIKPAYSFAPQINTRPVITGPLPAGSAELDPSAFLSFQNGMSQGMFFLEQQKVFESKLNGAPAPYDSQPQLTLGGKLEARGTFQSPYQGPNNSSMDLVTAELLILAQVSPWASGFMAIDYDNALLDPVLNGSGNPTNNSGFFLNRGFLTIGNLNKSPFFFSAGQMYAPFGLYATNMLSNPATKVLGRTNTRAAQLGFEKEGFHASVYGFNGFANIGNHTLNNWGAEAGYKISKGEYSGVFGVGFINNIAGAQGAQLTGGGPGTFQGFSQNPSTETLVHYVPGLNANILLAKGPLYFIAEAVAATRAYDPRDMTFNGVGAQPKAGHLETGYNFTVFGKKSIFNVAYEQTWDALAMGLPKNSYVATFSISAWKNTVEILEFRHDVNYAAGATSSGACTFVAPNNQVFTVCQGPVAGGGSQNTFLAQVGVYF